MHTRENCLHTNMRNVEAELIVARMSAQGWQVQQMGHVEPQGFWILFSRRVVTS